MPYAVDYETQPDAAPRLDRERVLEEVSKGLPNERDRLYEARVNQDFADLNHAPYEQMREGETKAEYEYRPKRRTGFVHQALGRLCAHTYNPGPVRTIEDGAISALMEQVYKQNHINAVMHEAERLSTTNDVAAIQVRWTGDRTPEKPIDLMLWGAEEFCVYESPDDPRIPEAVVTIDKLDNRTRYRVWFDDEVYSYLTGKAGGQDGRGTTGGVIAYLEEGWPRENPYGYCPFAFVHYKQPVRQFWTRSPGSFIRHAECEANEQASLIAEAIQKYLAPIALFINVPPEFNPEVGPGRFLRLYSMAGYDGDGATVPGQPDARYLQAQLEIEGAWQDVRNMLDQCAEACDLPPGSLRLDYTDAPSGFSIVCRNFPLLDRASARQPIYRRAETDLVRCVCAVYGAMADRTIRERGKDVDVLLAWPEPAIPVPGPDRDQSDSWELGIGIKSRLQVIQERKGLATREQAIAYVEQVAEDETEVRGILPEPEPEPGQEQGKESEKGDE